jgi:hypothetical protein
MLLRLSYFTLFVFLFSCSKDPVKTPLLGSVSFSANGTSYSWNEQNTSSAANYLTMDIYLSAPGIYHLNITNQFSGNLIPQKTVDLTFLTSALRTNTPFTYTNTTAVNPLFPPHQVVVSTVTGNDLTTVYNGYDIGDFATVTITGVHDQLADGNFTARLTRLSDLAKINITNGNFQNVKIMP